MTMCKFSLIAIAFLLSALTYSCDGLDEIFAWKEVSFKWPSEDAKKEATTSGQYIPENNLPLGLDRWKDKLFVTVPRWKSGVASSLNYISLNPVNKTGPLTPYPDWQSNTLPQNPPQNPTQSAQEPNLAENHIVSTFRVKVDSCDRLWVMDTGLADILGSPKQVSPQAILVFDLNTDKLLRRYELKATDLKPDSFFANIIVDVDPTDCANAYAYIPDLGAYSLVVYSLARNDSWRFAHNYFHFDPLKGDFNVGGVNFQWTDGIFGLALGPRNADGFRTLYFHPLASTREFSVSTQVLQNDTLAMDPGNYFLFKVEGDRGDLTQSSASDFDTKTNVLFLTQLNRDGVACWNPKKPVTPENIALVAHDKEALVFTNDIKIDAERNLWILSDRMPAFIYKGLDPKQVNYRIFKANIDDLIKDTACAVA